jgi:putative ABC transport system permease protein
MGSSRRYIYNVIVWQALLSAVIGFCIAALISDVVVRLTAATALPIVITPALVGGLFLLTVMMCIGSSIAAIVQVTRIDPAMVFTR